MDQDRRELGSLLALARDEAARFLAALDDRPVGRPVPAIDPLGLPRAGLGAAGALEELLARYGDHVSGSAGPRYFGFVTGGATPAALIGDWLTSVFDQNLADAGESSARQIALDALAMLRGLLGLPDELEGAFVTGATASATVALATARQWIGSVRGIDVARDGLGGLGPVHVVSGTPHASIAKSLSILGLGRGALATVPTLPDREAVDLDALERALAEIDRAGAGPAIVVANAGTVNTNDFDDLVAIAALRGRAPFWLHVDAAFGGIAAASARYRPLLAGLEAADSVTIDAHKWLNVPYDSGVIFTRHLELQGRVFGNTASYLPSAPARDAYVHLTPENSQRLRALPVWMTLAAYGREGYAAIVERNCDHARWIAARLAAHPRFDLLAAPRLNGVCFAVRAPSGERASPATVTRFLDLLARDGAVFATPTTYRGSAAIRLSITNWRTEEVDMERTWAALCRVAELVELVDPGDARGGAQIIAPSTSKH